MKTRVVRYWHKTDWLYRVDCYVESKTDDYTFDPQNGAPIEVIPKGTWRWTFYTPGGLSRDQAMAIAEKLSKGEDFDTADVIAEFE